MRPNEIELQGRIEFGSIEKMAATPCQESKHPRWERVVRRGPWKRRAECVGRWRAPTGFAFAGCRLHCRRAQVWDGRDGCMVLWAVISEAGKRNILSWNWESVQVRAHCFILSPSFIIHPFRSRSGLEWTMSMEIDRILKLERNGRSIGVRTGLPN